MSEYEKPETIATLSKRDLIKLLAQCFFMIGKNINNLTPDETESLLTEVYHWQGKIWVETFRQAFSGYAAGEIVIEHFNPTVNPLSVSRIQKAFREKTYGKAKGTNNYHAKNGTLTIEEKYMLFLQFVLANKCMPGNCDWVGVYEHLVSINKLHILSSGWESMTYYQKWKYALDEITQWAHNRFTINNTHLDKPGSNPLKGIGTRLSESHGIH